MKQINNSIELEKLFENGKPTLIDFYADWCGPCRVLMPTVEKLADKYKNDFNIVKINVDENKAIASQFGVRSIPALFFMEEGKVSEHLTGIQSSTFLEGKLAAYLKVDA